MSKKPTNGVLLKRQRLLRQLAGLSLLLEGSYIERFSTCVRKQCACHKGQKHGPRSYVVIYRDQKQRQVYVPQAQRRAVRQGLRQQQQLQALVQAITDLNLQLMREGRLTAKPHSPRKGERS